MRIYFENSKLRDLANDEKKSDSKTWQTTRKDLLQEIGVTLFRRNASRVKGFTREFP